MSREKMHTPLVLGLCGRARAGKDTVATMFKTAYPMLRQLQIGSPVKHASMSLFGFTSRQVDGPEKDILDDRYQCTPRELMMWLATSTIQKCGASHFSTRLGTPRLQELINECSTTPVIITDVRFEQDAQLVRSFEGSIVRIVRNMDEVMLARKFEKDTHRVNCDHLIRNDGTEEDLRRRVESLAKTLHMYVD